jgi:PIN domain nuclease of toxin-antitoxin system
MRLLVDTHAMIWYVDQDQLLSPVAHAAITDPNNDLLVSAASIWELGIKVDVGKLKLSDSYGVWTNRALNALRATILPITVDYVDRQSTLPDHHSDPFDRLLIAQSLVDSIPVVSNDVQFDAYQVQRIR